MKKGMEKGMEKGKHEEKIQIAVNSLALGFDVETVAKLTGLSVREIEELTND